MTISLRYASGPAQGQIKTRKIILGAGRIMSIGHSEKNTFQLPRSNDTRAVNAIIHGEGNASIVVSPKEGNASVSIRGNPYRTLEKKGIALSHGVRIRIGEHEFEVVDNEVKKPALALEYHSGPLQDSFGRKKLSLDFNRVMTIGTTKDASISLPAHREVHEKHAQITKDVENGSEVFHLREKQGPVWVSGRGGRYERLSKQRFRLDPGTRIVIGPHIFQIVQADSKPPPKTPAKIELMPIRSLYPGIRQSLFSMERHGLIRSGQASAIDAGMQRLMDVERTEHAFVHGFINHILSSYEMHSLRPQERADYLQNNLDMALFHYRYGKISQGADRNDHRLNPDRLDPYEHQLMHEVNQAIHIDGTDRAPAGYRYSAAYFSDPHQVNQIQNNIIAQKSKTQQDLWLQAAVTLNAKVESQHYPCIEPRIPSTYGYHALGAVGYLYEGDILPGRSFHLGYPYTYNREILEIKKTGDALPFLTAARKLATEGKSEMEIASAMNSKIHQETEYHNVDLTANQRAGPATILADKQGVCRHKAALLTMMLQEAGIRCQYMRGNYGHLGGHAWVQANIEGVQYLLDPTNGKRFALTGKNRDQNAARHYINHMPWNKVWRPYLRVK